MFGLSLHCPRRCRSQTKQIRQGRKFAYNVMKMMQVRTSEEYIFLHTQSHLCLCQPKLIYVVHPGRNLEQAMYKHIHS